MNEAADVDDLIEVPRRVRALVAEARLRLGGLLGAPGHPVDDEEAIHDFRVALRRLRSVLGPLREPYGRGAMRALGDRLRTIAAATGELRDEEVLRETLGELKLDAPTAAALGAWMAGRARRERGLRARVMRAIRAGVREEGDAGIVATLGAIEARLEAGPRRPEGDRSFAERAMHQAVDVVTARADAVVTGDVEAMHRLRIAWKKLRYVAEVFGNLSRLDARAAEKRATRMQKALGRLHDLDEAQARVGRAWGMPLEARRAVLAALAAQRAKTLNKCRAELPGELEAVIRACTPAAEREA